MNEIKSSTKVLLFSAVLMIVILLTGPFGYKFGIVDLMPSLISLLVALLGAVIVLIASLVFLVIAQKNGLAADRNFLSAALVLSLLPLLMVGPQIVTARSVPPIHDITTDTSEPPEFDVIVEHRVDALNSLDYGDEELPAEQLAALQAEAYPNVQPLTMSWSVEEAAAAAEAALKGLGMEVVNVDVEAGRVEATATTFWFGFKDDVVVRIRPDTEGVRIDIRSISRVGQSDLGANAARIESILAALRS